jgi:hypothetical protein
MKEFVREEADDVKNNGCEPRRLVEKDYSAGT